MERLRLIEPELATRLASAGPGQRSNVASAVSRWVVSRVPLLPAEVVGAANGAPASNLHKLADELDDTYLTLGERLEMTGIGTEEEVDLAFSRARAACCVALAHDDEPSEAIYEAHAATGDLTALRELVIQALDAPTT